MLKLLKKRKVLEANQQYEPIKQTTKNIIKNSSLKNKYRNACDKRKKKKKRFLLINFEIKTVLKVTAAKKPARTATNEANHKRSVK